jgi:hypothetical protein
VASFADVACRGSCRRAEEDEDDDDDDVVLLVVRRPATASLTSTTSSWTAVLDFTTTGRGGGDDDDDDDDDPVATRPSRGSTGSAAAVAALFCPPPVLVVASTAGTSFRFRRCFRAVGVAVSMLPALDSPSLAIRIAPARESVLSSSNTRTTRLRDATGDDPPPALDVRGSRPKRGATGRDDDNDDGLLQDVNESARPIRSSRAFSRRKAEIKDFMTERWSGSIARAGHGDRSAGKSTCEVADRWRCSRTRHHSMANFKIFSSGLRPIL